MSRHSTTRTPTVGLFFILWLLFALALLFNQGALNAAWQWLTGLPLVLQIVAWVLFLPITLGLWIWESDWALWLRLLSVIIIAVGNLAAFSPRQARSDRGGTTPADVSAARHEAPPSSTNV